MAMGALVAAAWGGLAGSALLLGALLGLYARASRAMIAGIMAVGAGTLVSAVAFDLMDEAYQTGGLDAAAVGMAAGAVLYFVVDSAIARAGGKHRKRSQGQQAKSGSAGMAIFAGSLMDGIPESAAIGITLLAGGAVSWVFVAAVFLSNVPEGMSAASGLSKSGRSNRYILSMWGAVVIVSALSAALGYLLLRGVSENITGGIQSFAAGAILAMLASTMFPEAHEEGGPVVGVLTALGFLMAFVLGKLA